MSSAATVAAPGSDKSYGNAWVALAFALACHVTDEALTGFLPIYNMTVLEARRHVPWFPMPAFGFTEWLTGLIAGVALLFILTPLAYRGSRRLRPLAWFLAVMMLLNAAGHTVATALGHTFPDIRFARPAPGFYSSPLLAVASIWLLLRLRKTAA